MADKLQSWFFLCLLLVFVLPFSSCQPQNIETSYPYDISPSSPANPPTLNPPPPPRTPQVEPPVLAPPSVSSSDNRGTIVKAVVATAASTLVFALLFFFVLQKYVIARRRRDKVGDSPPSPGGGTGRPVVVAPNDLHNFTRVDGNLKGSIVDEDGLDVLYWRRLEEGDRKKSFHREVFNNPKPEEERHGMMTHKSEAIQEVPLLRGKSSSSEISIPPEENDSDWSIASKPPPPPPATLRTIEEHEPSIQLSTSVPSPPPPPPPPPQTQNKKSPTPPPPPPPIPGKKNPGPPPPPPPIPGKKNPAPPPPPPKANGLTSSLKPPSGSSKGTSSQDSKTGESSAEEEAGNGQVKLKPLHWDKVNKNVEHSMVWDKIGGGSFRFDGDLMEALFGYVAATKKSPRGDDNSKNPSSLNLDSSQVLILDPRKSQNSAIVLRTLALSRKELLSALTEGKGLNVETLEKLTRIAPTVEEQSQILGYEGDPTRLADAESFHYHLLKAIPSSYTRLNAMLFRSNYDSEILQLKESLQTLELGCRELRTRGLFMKLLEAVLKAGNRMNAGTARGNAQAFNLTALRKLSDVKSTDGKTTLLHFVVTEVVRSEGKRCVLNRNRSLSRSSSTGSNSSASENSTSKDERDKEYIMLGLPVVGGLSAEFFNVKKAATLDYDSFKGTCRALSARAAEIQQLVSRCEGDGGGGFVREMKSFLELAGEELKTLREEQTGVVELVKQTTEYYQTGARKHEGALQLQLFVIIKDFLGMVDQVCIEIARNMQRRRASKGGSSPKSPALRGPIRFPNLPEHFLSDKSKSTSSESDSDS